MQTDTLEFVIGNDPIHWPRLTACPDRADVLYLHNAGFELDAGRKVSFAGDGQLQSATALRFLTEGAERLCIQPDGKVGIGMTTPAHALEVNGTINASDFLKDGQPLTTSQWASHGSDISFTGGQVGIGTDKPAHALDVNGAVNAAGLQVAGAATIGSELIELMTGRNPIRFTSAWSFFPDDKTNGAEISNDTKDYKTLMIVGNQSGGKRRRVSVWDRLEVNGVLSVTETLIVKGQLEAEQGVTVGKDKKVKVIDSDGKWIGKAMEAYIIAPSDPSDRHAIIRGGTVALDSRGEADVVAFPLASPTPTPSLPIPTLVEKFAIQLTAVYQPAPNLYCVPDTSSSEIRFGRFKIAGGEPDMTVYWQATCIMSVGWLSQQDPSMPRGT